MNKNDFQNLLLGLRPLSSGYPKWIEKSVAIGSFLALIFLSLGFLFSLVGVAVTLLLGGLLLEKVFGLQVFPNTAFYA